MNKVKVVHGARSIIRTSLMIFLILFVLLILIDYLAVFFHHPSILDVNASILIVDVDGLLEGKVTNTSRVVIVHGMGVNDFRVLGDSRVDVIVFVAHGLELEGNGLTIGLSPGDYALETSEDSNVWVILLHPLMVITNSIVRGEIPILPGEKIAVTRNIFYFSKPFKNKTIVLLTCGTPKIKLFAKAFLEHGARRVLYLEKPIDINIVYEIIDNIYKLKSVDNIIGLLKNYGFKIMYR